MMDFTLAQRLRRLRQSPGIRDLVRETHLTKTTLVYPLFVCTGSGIRKEVPSMPGVFKLSVDQALVEMLQGTAIESLHHNGEKIGKDD
mgnify:CR=1 FL=1